MIANIKKTKEILDKYQKRANKGFGQNFLIDQNITKKIIESANLDHDTGVIEIGPGLGSLTQYLSINAKKVLAYEIDDVMIDILEETLLEYSNVKVLHQDVLSANIIEDINKYLSGCETIVVVANLPYYITTPIIFKFLELDFEFDHYIFMVQKELAERLTGKPKSKDYNALSVVMEYKTNSKILFNVSNSCFYPIPKVESSVIKIIAADKGYDIENEENFFKFVRGIFSNRRKTLANNINASFKIDKKTVLDLFSINKIEGNVRPEELSINEIIDIFKIFANLLNA